MFVCDRERPFYVHIWFSGDRFYVRGWLRVFDGFPYSSGMARVFIGGPYVIKRMSTFHDDARWCQWAFLQRSVLVPFEEVHMERLVCWHFGESRFGRFVDVRC